MMYPFRAPLAYLGVESPDHRWLDPKGTWTLGPRTYIHDRDDVPLGWILGLEVVGHVLWAIGESEDGGLAADLHGGQRALSVDMDSLQTRICGFGYVLVEITAGRVRSAMVVEPSAYLWTGPS